MSIYGQLRIVSKWSLGSLAISLLFAAFAVLLFVRGASAQTYSNGGNTVSWYRDVSGIRAFVNSKAAEFGYTTIPTSGKSSALLYNTVTATKVCEIAGYSKLVSFSCESEHDGGRCGWYSPGDNLLSWWSTTLNNFQSAGATSTSPYNKWIGGLVCTDRITYCIQGTVSGAVAGVTVTAGGVSAATTSTGAYSICGLLNGAYTVVPSHPDFNFSPGTRSATINRANVTGVNFTAAAKTYCIHGQVSGAVAGVTVSAGGKSATTDVYGNYDLCPLTNGNYTAVPSHINYTFTPSLRAVTISHASATGVDFTARIKQCQDQKDNDGDGLIDMADPGCAVPGDDCEVDDTSQCQDKKDNDSDGLIDMADPGCSTPQDNSESDGTSQCQDKKDNDGDGLIDMADPGCSTPQDYNESDGTSQCQDKKDNDSDGLVDDADPGCWTNILDPTTYDPKLNNESRATAQCQDKKDNDGDGAIDYPSDFSCSAPTDTNEALPKSPCQDGRDNDGDGLIDAADPGCWKDPSNASTYNAQDNDEYHVIAVPACRDGIDNDLDGVTDAADPGCWTNPNDPGTCDDKRDDESCATTQCQDKQDNDTDALVDWEDPGCWSDPNDPSTYDRTRNNEACATTQCQDKKDNDGDSLVDAADPGCRDIPSDPSSYRPRDNDEEDEVIPPSECEDKIDNDGDGLVDQTDPGCWTDPSDPDTFDPDADDEGRSTTQCQDGLDNDGDGLIDFPLDPECSSRTDNSEGEDGGSCGLAATQKIKSVIVTNNHDLGAIAQKNAKVLRKEVRKIRDIPGLTAPTTLERFYQSGLSNVKKTLAALDDLTQQLPEVLNPCPGTKVCSATVSNLKEKNQMVKNTIKLTKLAKRITRRLWYYQQVENPMVPFGSRLATERLEMRRANKQDRKNAEIFKRNLLAAVAEVPDTTKVCS